MLAYLHPSFTLPLILALLMWGMGTTLSWSDFQRITIYPKAVIIGLTNQLILLPLLGLLVIWSIPMPANIAVGVMIIAACPGGATSNLLSHLSKGDLALSITLTAFSSLITVFSIPILVNLALSQWVGSTQNISLDIGKTIFNLFKLTILPVAVGMLLKARFPQICQKLQKPISVVSVIFILLALAIVVQQLSERGSVAVFISQAGPAVLMLIILAFALGFFSAGSLGLPFSQRVAISIETGVQNNVLGITIATAFLNQPEMGTAAGVHAIFMCTIGFALVYVFAQVQKRLAD